MARLPSSDAAENPRTGNETFPSDHVAGRTLSGRRSSPNLERGCGITIRKPPGDAQREQCARTGRSSDLYPVAVAM